MSSIKIYESIFPTRSHARPPELPHLTLCHQSCVRKRGKSFFHQMSVHAVLNFQIQPRTTKVVAVNEVRALHDKSFIRIIASRAPSVNRDLGLTNSSARRARIIGHAHRVSPVHSPLPPAMLNRSSIDQEIQLWKCLRCIA
jgi:hypothetical protein